MSSFKLCHVPLTSAVQRRHLVPLLRQYIYREAFCAVSSGACVFNCTVRSKEQMASVAKKGSENSVDHTAVLALVRHNDTGCSMVRWDITAQKVGNRRMLLELI